MKLADIKKRAQQINLSGISRMRKPDLIRAIQTKEGNQPCFGADWRFECGQEDCCWREDCRIDQPG